MFKSYPIYFNIFQHHISTFSLVMVSTIPSHCKANPEEEEPEVPGEASQDHAVVAVSDEEPKKNGRFADFDR